MTRTKEIKQALEAAMVALAERRGPASSFCPSEAARQVAVDWRPLMPVVREMSVELGLEATQKGVPVDAVTARGPIRLRKRA